MSGPRIIRVPCPECGGAIPIPPDALASWPRLRSAYAWCPNCQQVVLIPGQYYAKPFPDGDGGGEG